MKSSSIFLQCALTSFCFSAAFVRTYNRHYSPSSVIRRNVNPLSMIGNKQCSSNTFLSRKRFASVASIDETISETSEKATRYSLDSLVSFAKVLWDFTRPHTIVGSGISVVALYTYGTPPHLWGTYKFFSSLASCLLPALLMNIYITGLNQVTDVEIDRINKPYLPIAAGNLSKEHGIIVVIASLISSLYLVRNAAWPLQAVVTGSCILGTLYSMPPFRLKRYPLLAAFCILIVRGTLVNMGFFLHAKVQVLGESIPSVMSACRMFPESVLLTVYFAIFGVVIALMKDVPDVKGDRMNSISSFSVKLGAANMFR